MLSTSCSHGTLCSTTFLFTYSLPSLTSYTLALGSPFVLLTFVFIYIGYLKLSARFTNDEAYDGKEDVRPSKRKEQKAVTTGDNEAAQRPTIFNSVMDDDDRL